MIINIFVVGKVVVKIDDEDKENSVLTTPRKSPRGGGTTGGEVLSPLSPSKRSINVDASESPTKRLQLSALHISSQEDDTLRPPRMNWTLAAGKF